MANRARGRKTDYQWQGSTGSTGSIQEAIVINSQLLVNAPATLVRTRGEMVFSIDGPAR